METLNGDIMNLANSIIGVSVLAMPYCFKQCGIILSVVLLIINSLVSRLTCHFLLKSAILSRRKTFELLAFHLFGRLGKLIIEIGLIGFLLGTCIAYFVVMGDLGPLIIAEVTKSNVSNTMHTAILLSLAVLIILPLSLLRNIHSLNSVSRATMIFYCCLVLKVIVEALPHLFQENWYDKINLWRPEGILQCLPIFSYSLFCQSQLFEIYEVVPNPTLDKMNNLIKTAIHFCTSVYICVGIFGYIAFADKDITGNILLYFEPSLISHIMKVGFIFSVAFSFPLSIFPCRASLYSLLYKEGYHIHEGNLNYIPEFKFKSLTFIIVSVSVTVAILIPNIELVLGLVGSTIGVMICVLFPVTCFICISKKNTSERIVAQILMAVGIFVMVVGTYKNIQKVDNLSELPLVTDKTVNKANHNLDNFPSLDNKLPYTEKLESKIELPQTEKVIKEFRHEPPQPVEPEPEEEKQDRKFKKEKVDPIKPPEKTQILKQKESSLNDTVDIEAIRKEDVEEQLEKKEKTKELPEEFVDDQKKLIDTIQKQNEVQKEIVKQQKQLLEEMKLHQKKEENKKFDEVKQEKMKAVKEIESIALKAIEKISDGEDSKRVVDDLKKGIEKNEREILRDATIEKRIEDEGTKPKVNIGHETNKIPEESEKDVKNVNLEIHEPNLQLNQSDIKIKNKEGISLQEINKNDHLEAVNKDMIKNKEVEQTPKNEDKLDQVRGKNRSLFLKLGSNELKITDEKNPSKLLPLPIVISNNALKKNVTKTDTAPVLKAKDENGLIGKNQAEEVQVMRRDILSTKNEMV